MKYTMIENDKVIFSGSVAYRIKALKSFKCQDRVVTAGDLGGYIEKKENLCNTDSSWVFDNAVISGDAEVYEDSMVEKNATISGNAKISANSRITDDANIYGNAKIMGSTITRRCEICGEASIISSLIKDYACIDKNAYVYKSDVSEHSHIHNAFVFSSYVSGRSILSGNISFRICKIDSSRPATIGRNVYSYYKNFSAVVVDGLIDDSHPLHIIPINHGLSQFSVLAIYNGNSAPKNAYKCSISYSDSFNNLNHIHNMYSDGIILELLHNDDMVLGEGYKDTIISKKVKNFLVDAHDSSRNITTYKSNIFNITEVATKNLLKFFNSFKDLKDVKADLFPFIKRYIFAQLFGLCFNDKITNLGKTQSSEEDRISVLNVDAIYEKIIEKSQIDISTNNIISLDDNIFFYNREILFFIKEEMRYPLAWVDNMEKVLSRNEYAFLLK